MTQVTLPNTTFYTRPRTEVLSGSVTCVTSRARPQQSSAPQPQPTIESSHDMTHFLTTDDGQPLGVVDVSQIQNQGARLAFRLAASCDDPGRLGAIVAETLAAVGVGAFGFVAAAALRCLAEQVLDPALEAGEAAGVHLRTGLVALAEGRDPSTGSVI